MKKLFKTKWLILFFALTMFGCSENNILEYSKNDVEDDFSEVNIDSQVVLGKTIENLLSIDEIRACSPEFESVESNYIYFRCRTNVLSELDWLSNENKLMSTIPLDREILEGGTVYTDLENCDNSSSWYYFIKNIEDFNEIKRHNFEVDILDEMYLDDEDIALLTGEGLDIPEDTYLTVDLTNDETRSLKSFFKKIKKVIQKYFANNPAGQVNVYNSITKKYEPVKNVTVITNQLGLIGFSVTDKNGKFKIPVAYTSLAGPVQVMIAFENSDFCIHSYDSWKESVSTLLTNSVVYYEGSHWIEGLSKLKINLKENTKAAKYATVMNAYSDFINLCNKFNLAKPKSLKVLVTDEIENSAAPMLRYGGSDYISVLSATLLEPILGIPVSAIAKPYMPDIVIGTKRHGSDLYASVFHELSHASHFFGLGSKGRAVWLQEYIDMLTQWGKMCADGESLTADPYNNGGSDLIKLIESWGYFSEGFLLYDRFNIPVYLDRLENRLIRFDVNGKELNSVKHFYYGGFYDLLDEFNEENIDFCQGYTYQDIYKALINANILNINNFASSLVVYTKREPDLDNVIKTLKSNCD